MDKTNFEKLDGEIKVDCFLVLVKMYDPERMN